MRPGLLRTCARPGALLALWLALAACGGQAPGPGDSAPIAVASLVEVGTVPRPEGHDGRDVGFSAVLGGRSVWIFGDTFLPGKAADGLAWRSSTWSWTEDFDGADGVGPFMHALDDDGLARQLLPHTEAEAVYNRAHEGHEDCPAAADCGSRRTPWPQALVTDPSGQAGVIYYVNMETGAGGAWDFRSVSGSVALWDDPAAPAVRVEPPLFGDDEPDWGAAAVWVDGTLFVYACEGREKPCLLASVPFESAADRGRYRFWAGPEGWSTDWTRAVPVFTGASLFSVHFDAHLGAYLAVYMAGMGGDIYARSAPRPEGPWSAPVFLGQGLPAYEDWDYALIAHPELSREAGRVQILSYTRPSGFLAQETRLLELRLR